MIWPIIATLLFTGGAFLVARSALGLERPMKLWVAIGVLGALLTVFGIEVEIDPTAPGESTRWLALIGSLLSFVALLGLLGLVLVWAIRRWGFADNNRPENER